MTIEGNCVAVGKSHKILRASVPNELFYGFIEKIATKIPNTNYYLIDVAAYKKSTYVDDDDDANGLSLPLPLPCQPPCLPPLPPAPAS